MGAGVQAGPFNVGQGVANLLFGTSTPTMYDQASKKWVVKSSGLTGALNFYKEVYAQGLGASTSQLFTTEAIGTPVNLMKQQKLAITLASNWMPEAWVTPHTTFYWPQSSKTVGIAPIPTQFGQSPGVAGEISGWAFGVSKASGNPTAAWNLVKMNLETTNQLDMALWSGFVSAVVDRGQHAEEPRVRAAVPGCFQQLPEIRPASAVQREFHCVRARAKPGHRRHRAGSEDVAVFHPVVVQFFCLATAWAASNRVKELS